MCCSPASAAAQGGIASGCGLLAVSSPPSCCLWLDRFWQTTLAVLCLAACSCDSWREVHAQVSASLERGRGAPAKKHNHRPAPVSLSVFKSRHLGLVYCPACLGHYQSPHMIPLPGVPVALWCVTALRSPWFLQGKYQLKESKWYITHYWRD